MAEETTETEQTDPLFQDAVEALRQGQRAHAKEILTGLLKADQSNAQYWVWMSAAVDTPKERIYCLETAYKLDPKNGVAKRGLMLLGALAPDDKIQPFPLNRPRAWEEKLLLEHERPKEKGVRVALSTPVARLAQVLVVGALVIGLAVYGLLGRRSATTGPSSQATAGPSPTFTLTPTFANATGQPISTQHGPTPLAVLAGVLIHGYTALRQHAARADLAGYLSRRQSRLPTGELGPVHQQHERGRHDRARCSGHSLLYRRGVPI